MKQLQIALILSLTLPAIGYAAELQRPVPSEHRFNRNDSNDSFNSPTQIRQFSNNNDRIERANFRPPHITLSPPIAQRPIHIDHRPPQVIHQPPQVIYQPPIVTQRPIQIAHRHSNIRFYTPNLWLRSNVIFPWWDPFPHNFPNRTVIIEKVKQEPVIYIEREEVGNENSKQTTKQQLSSNADKSWYYCSSSNEYYPKVPSCSEGWEKVPYTSN